MTHACVVDRVFKLVKSGVEHNAPELELDKYIWITSDKAIMLYDARSGEKYRVTIEKVQPPLVSKGEDQ